MTVNYSVTDHCLIGNS